MHYYILEQILKIISRVRGNFFPIAMHVNLDVLPQVIFIHGIHGVSQKTLDQMGIISGIA